MKKLESHSLDVWVLCGFLGLGLIVWNRFLRLRWPSSMEEIWSRGPLWVFFLGLFSVALVVLSLALLVSRLRGPSDLPPWVRSLTLSLDHPFLRPLGQALVNLSEGPERFLAYVFVHGPLAGGLYRWGLALSRWFGLHASRWSMEVTFWLLYALPQALVATVFLLELLHWHGLVHFYGFLPLLGLPLVLRLSRYVWHYFARFHTSGLLDHTLRWELMDQNSHLRLFFPLYDGPSEDPDFVLRVDEFIVLEYACTCLEEIASYWRKHSPYVQLYVHGLYALGWFQVILAGLGLTPALLAGLDDQLLLWILVQS